MKKMSQKELDRLGKKKGFTIKRKMGAQPKKPEPEVKDEIALSGAIEAEAPAPASSEFYAVMDKLTDILSHMTKPMPEEMPGSTVEEALPLEIAPESEEILPVAAAVSSSTSWTHTAKRDTKTGLMKQVISSEELGEATWVHEFVRIKKRIVKVVSKSNSGVEFLHQINRNQKALISGAKTTLVLN